METVLIIDAPEEQIKILATLIEHRGQAYNVYFYRQEMNQPEWFDLVARKADVVIDAKLTNPEDYFNK